MNKADLLSFIALSEEKSFTRAAERLHITQPALSKRIANLESSLENILFNRAGKQVQLSQAGELFLQHAQALLGAMNNCETDLLNLRSQVAGVLKLGVSHHIGLHRLPPYLKEFTQQHPNVQLQISFVDSEKAYAMVLNGELEIALATLAPHHYHDIKEQSIWNDPLSFVVSPQHPLAQLKKQSGISLQTLSEYAAILPSENTYTGKLVQQLLKSQKIRLAQTIETNYLETIKMMTSIGIGWAVLPSSMLSAELCSLPISNTALTRQLGLIHHANFILSNASKAFIATLP